MRGRAAGSQRRSGTAPDCAIWRVRNCLMSGRYTRTKFRVSGRACVTGERRGVWPCAMPQETVCSAEIARPCLLEWSSIPGGPILFTTFRDGNDNLYMMNADGTGAQTLLVDTGEHDWQPDWSPDGTWIVFTQQDITTGNDEIWVVDANGSSGPHHDRGRPEPDAGDDRPRRRFETVMGPLIGS